MFYENEKRFHNEKNPLNSKKNSSEGLFEPSLSFNPFFAKEESVATPHHAFNINSNIFLRNKKKRKICDNPEFIALKNNSSKKKKNLDILEKFATDKIQINLKDFGPRIILSSILQKKELQNQNNKTIYVRESTALPQNQYPLNDKYDHSQKSLSSENKLNISLYFEELKKLNLKKNLYAFLKLFPKGGDTHSHLTGAIKVNDYLILAQQKNLFFSLNYDKDMTPHFHFYKNGNASKTRPASELIKNYFLNEIFTKAATVGKGNNFFETFSNFESIDPYLSLSDYLFPLLKRACNSNILYLEVSKGFEVNFNNWNKENSEKYFKNFPDVNAFNGQNYEKKLNKKFNFLSKALQNEKKLYIKYIDQFADSEIPDFLKIKSFNKPFFSLDNPVVIRINGDVNRESSLPQFFADLTLSYLMVQYELDTYGTMARMLGVVISGREFTQPSVLNLKAQLKMLNFLKSKFPAVQCSIHAGEMSEVNSEINVMTSALSRVLKYAEPQRIGHGTCIKHDKNLKKILSKIKCVEICPTSSQAILKIKKEAHPFKLLMQHNVPVTINTDDAGVLCTSLTKEFIKAIKWHSDLDYKALVNLARNQIRYSFLQGEEIFENLSPYQYHLRPCFEKFDNEAKEILARSPKATLQYRLEMSFSKFEYNCLNQENKGST